MLNVFIWELSPNMFKESLSMTYSKNINILNIIFAFIFKFLGPNKVSSSLQSIIYNFFSDFYATKGQPQARAIYLFEVICAENCCLYILMLD